MVSKFLKEIEGLKLKKLLFSAEGTCASVIENLLSYLEFEKIEIIYTFRRSDLLLESRYSHYIKTSKRRCSPDEL